MGVENDKATKKEEKLDSRMTGTEDMIEIDAGHHYCFRRVELFSGSFKMKNTYEKRCNPAAILEGSNISIFVRREAPRSWRLYAHSDQSLEERRRRRNKRNRRRVRAASLTGWPYYIIMWLVHYLKMH